MQDNPDPELPRIAVCILTRMRSAGLMRALEGVARQAVHPSEFARIRVIVIDNDPNGSAEQVCDRIRPTYPWSLDYSLEPVVGIPQARNRALDMAIEDDDLLAFLDDDEVPTKGWLAELTRVHREYSSDVVFGPVPPFFPEPVPGWVQKGGFFQRQSRPTGSICRTGGTGNVLISSRMLIKSGLRFDERYRFSGGSDYVFFYSVSQAGYRMVWAEDAVAQEWIPRSRTTLKWLASRHFRCGAIDGRKTSIAQRSRIVILGVLRFLFGASCAVAFLPFGRHRSVKAIRWASYGLGLLYGASGRHFEEYRTVRSV